MIHVTEDVSSEFSCLFLLQTPPVSTGSINSEEQNDSRAPSEIDSSEIPIKQEKQWVVKDSASNIEMVNKYKIVVTR